MSYNDFRSLRLTFLSCEILWSNIEAVFSLPPFACRNEAVSCEHSINYSNKSRIVQMGNGGARG